MIFSGCYDWALIVSKERFNNPNIQEKQYTNLNTQHIPRAYLEKRDRSSTVVYAKCNNTPVVNGIPIYGIQIINFFIAFVG